jgi:hypothetical protein
MRKLRVMIAGVLLVIVLWLVQGCEQDDPIRNDTNRPPETFLSVAPENLGKAFHKYRVRWTGLDRDGVVTDYKVASVAEDEIYGGVSGDDTTQYLLDLDWRITDATESLFVFTADRPNARNHSLYVVAVDNEGKEDPSPARVNFTAIDYELPEIVVKISDNLDPVPRVPPEEGDTLPQYNLQNPGEPIVIKLSWEGSDPDGSILEWKYRLDSGSEVTVPSDVDSVVFVYDPDNPAESDVWIGFHEFRLVAIDDAMARSDENVARFVINYDPDTYIDSVWTFRGATDKGLDTDPLPEKLVFARAWRDSPEVYSDVDRVVYHFGQLRLKFHGSDLDRLPGDEPPEEFKWSIKGTLLNSDWISNPCGEEGEVDFYCAVTDSYPYLDSDRPFTLFVNARDRAGKSDGSPDTIMFMVNVAPEILDITHEDLGNEVRFEWEISDPDEGARWGVGVGEQETALVKYQYRIDEGPWQDVLRRDRYSPGRAYYVKYAEVSGIEPGEHTFELHAFNGDYFETRADWETYTFNKD